MFKSILRSKGSYLLLVPSFVLVIVFYYYPALSGIYHAFTRWRAVDESTWVGLDNFAEMLRDPFVRRGLWNQVILTFSDMLKMLVGPFIVAELIFTLPGENERYWFRSFFIIPMVVPMMVLILMWYFIYDPNIGLLNQLIEAIGWPSLKQAWLGDPDTALLSIIGVGFPWISGLAFLIFFAGLNNLPLDILDASRIDGASTFRRILFVDIPMMIPQFRLVIVLTLIVSIQDFGRILVLTGGGPGLSTYVPGLWMYEQTFLISRFGYASAIGFSLFVIILVGSGIVLKLMKSGEEF